LLVLVLAVGIWRYGVVFDPQPVGLLPPTSAPILNWSVPDVDWLAVALALAALATVGTGAWYFSDKPRLYTSIYVIAVVLLVYYLYRYGLLNIPRTIALYVLVGVGMAMVWNYINGFTWFSLELLLAICFLMLGFSHSKSWEEFTAMLAWPTWTSTRQVAYTQPVQTSPGCDGTARTFNFGAAVYTVNGNFCQLRGYVESGCVKWLSADKRVLARSCQGPMPSVPGITHIIADSSAVVRLNHCRPFAPGALVDTCS